MEPHLLFAKRDINCPRENCILFPKTPSGKHFPKQAKVFTAIKNRIPLILKNCRVKIALLIHRKEENR
jgi:hypothetical protein